MESGVSGGEGVQAIHPDVLLPPAESGGEMRLWRHTQWDVATGKYCGRKELVSND